MAEILLTQNSTPIFKYIVWLLGKIMNIIFEFLDLITGGNPNIGVAIILFTIVTNLLLLPLTIKQQKFSKFSARMNPEIQAIQKKYRGKKDQVSMMAMNQETQAVYAKYGVSPSGSCLQLLIQLPVLFALYRVIYSIPAYVDKVKASFTPIVNSLTESDISVFKELFGDTSRLSQYISKLKGTGEALSNRFIDVMNNFNASDWDTLRGHYSELTDVINNAESQLDNFNSFFSLNVAYSPSYIISNAMDAGNWLLLIGALMIPLLAGLTQFISVKLMPQAAANNDSNNEGTMAASLKTMNMIMPIMSIIFCYTLPCGLGIYWIAGAVVRTVLQIIVNKQIDKIDIEEMMKANIEKNNIKRAKMGLPPQQLNTNANISTKSVNSSKSEKSEEERKSQIQKSTEYYNKNAKPGSIAAKANMVKQYNEKNNK